MWGGIGDRSALSTGDRGFSFTSMSMLIFIQPNALLSEILNMTADDGFLDRVLMTATTPQPRTMAEMRAAKTLLDGSSIDAVYKIFEQIDGLHRSANIIYRLQAPDALSTFEEYADSFVEFMKEKWENGNKGDGDGNNSMIVSSKDAVHVLRLSVNLYILATTIEALLKGEDVEIQQQIPEVYVQHAKTIYSSIQQQKSVFLQVASSLAGTSTIKITGSIQTLRSKIIRTIVNLPGPMVTPRDVQKRVYDVTIEAVKSVLSDIATEGLGTVHIPRTGRLKFCFFKWLPNTDEGKKLVEDANISMVEYEQKFWNMTEKVTQTVNTACRNHPQIELLMDSNFFSD